LADEVGLIEAEDVSGGAVTDGGKIFRGYVTTVPKHRYKLDAGHGGEFCKWPPVVIPAEAQLDKFLRRG